MRPNHHISTLFLSFCDSGNNDHDIIFVHKIHVLQSELPRVF